MKRLPVATVPHLLVTACASLMAFGVPSQASAEGTTSSGGEATESESAALPETTQEAILTPSTAPTLVRRAHTVVMIDVGILMLPGAPISKGSQGGKTPFGTVGSGDATVLAGLETWFRPDPAWAFGGLLRFGPTPTSEVVQVEGTNLTRSHSRAYFDIGAHARFYPLRTPWVDAWLGPTLGLVVVADRYETRVARPRPANFGKPESTLSTEGATLGLHAGVDWAATDRWVATASFRGDLWVLPSTPATNSVGDTATLAGVTGAFQLTVGVGYRLPL